MALQTAAGSEWERAIREGKALSFQELARYEALVAEVPELSQLEEEVERVVRSDEQAGLVELARRRDKAIEAHPRVWAARERWRAAMLLVETIEARAKGRVR